MTNGISGDHPFATPPDQRDPARQFRGRLVAGVTVLTAQSDNVRAGLTASSVMVAEGDPPRVLVLVNDASDFWEIVQDSRRFVIHVLASDAMHLSEEFAALRPRPGGPFGDRAVIPTEWGPVLDEVTTRAFCSVDRTRSVGFLELIEASIDAIDVGDLSDPLLHFRGSYRRLSDDR